MTETHDDLRPGWSGVPATLIPKLIVRTLQRTPWLRSSLESPSEFGEKTPCRFMIQPDQRAQSAGQLDEVAAG